VPGSFWGWPVAAKGTQVKTGFFVDPQGRSHPSLLEMMGNTDGWNNEEIERMKNEGLTAEGLTADEKQPMWLCSSLLKDRPDEGIYCCC
jgi:hypothetical protein